MTRKGYEGYIVKAEKLIEVATALRDELGYDYLVFRHRRGLPARRA